MRSLTETQRETVVETVAATVAADRDRVVRILQVTADTSYWKLMV